MTTHGHLEDARWRKSSYSGMDNANCLEIADNIPGVIPVRDSKNPLGPTLLFTPEAWSAFVTALRTGNLPTT